MHERIVYLVDIVVAAIDTLGIRSFTVLELIYVKTHTCHLKQDAPVLIVIDGVEAVQNGLNTSLRIIELIFLCIFRLDQPFSNVSICHDELVTVAYSVSLAPHEVHLVKQA